MSSDALSFCLRPKPRQAAAGAVFEVAQATIGELMTAPSEDWCFAANRLAWIALRDADDPESGNPQSLAMAIIFSHELMQKGVPAPLPSLDSDGDVVLNWFDKDRQTFVLVTGEHLSVLAMEGTEVAFIGKKWKANAAGMRQIGEEFGEASPKWKVAQQSSFVKLITSKPSADISSGRAWSTASRQAYFQCALQVHSSFAPTSPPDVASNLSIGFP